MPESFTYNTVENDVAVEKTGSRLLYKDETIVTFNHHNDSSRSSAQSQDQFGLSKEEKKEKLNHQLEMYGIPELSPEEIEAMTEEDMDDYKEQKDMEEKHKKEIFRQIDSSDPYENFNGVNVIDTDYENYLIMYSCFQFDDDESGH